MLQKGLTSYVVAKISKVCKFTKLKLFAKKLKKFLSKFGFNIAFAFDKLYMGRKS